jgi:hypothetical protein
MRIFLRNLPVINQTTSLRLTALPPVCDGMLADPCDDVNARFEIIQTLKQVSIGPWQSSASMSFHASRGLTP